MRDWPLIITAFPEAREIGSWETPPEFMLRTRDDVYQPGLPAKPGEHYRAFVRFAAQHAGKTILDLGCGYGAYSLALAAEEGRQCVGSDVNMHYLASASGSGLPVVAVDSVLPFPDRSFDTVILLEVIEHVPLEGDISDVCSGA
jgi:2-polyprenyl-3-methyl-5-hydroxy-6-metoxy-1,4-benzoquinol methylase